MSPASVTLVLLLLLSRLSLQCNKAVVEHKDHHQDVIEEHKDDHQDVIEEPKVTEDSDYDYNDVSATSDEDHDEEDDSGDAFPDAEDAEQLCADVSDAPKHQTLPGAVIFGTKKGGTQALLEFLNMHSQIKRAKNEVII